MIRLLFERGQGWLRWGTEMRTGYDNLGEGLVVPYPYMVAPPLRRLGMYLWQWVRVPDLMLIGRVFDGKRYRFAWEEVAPCWPSELRDKDRGR